MKIFIATVLFSIFLSSCRHDGSFESYIDREGNFHELKYEIVGVDTIFYLRVNYSAEAKTCKYEVAKPNGLFEKNGEYYCINAASDTIETGMLSSDSICLWKKIFSSSGEVAYEMRVRSKEIKEEYSYFENGNVKAYLVSYNGELKQRFGEVKYAVLFDSLENGKIRKTLGDPYLTIVNGVKNFSIYEVEIISLIPSFFKEKDKFLFAKGEGSFQLLSDTNYYAFEQSRNFLKVSIPESEVIHLKHLLLVKWNNTLSGQAGIDSIDLNVVPYRKILIR